MLRFHRRHKAAAYHRACAAMLEEGRDAAAFFKQPIQICKGAGLSDDSARLISYSAEELVYMMESTIGTDGKAKSIRIIEGTGPIRRTRLLTDLPSFALFRPAMHDGELIKTEGYRFEYRAY